MSITKELRGFADDLDWHMWSNDDLARKLRAIADQIDAEHERRMEQAEPVFIVKLTGILRPEDLERYARKFSEELPGRVVVVDNRVEDIYMTTRLDVERLVMMLEETAND